MRMTIEEAITWLNTDDFESKGFAEATSVAINTMRKYQKIKEIMSELNGNFYGSYLKDRQVLEKIYEVIEDGNNN